jgi:nitrite reductase/ring-hydroxylating ferredoxin subunit
MLMCFIVAFVLRRNANSDNVILASLEVLGIVLMIIAGWMGGTLVYRNQIGVDIRYANAGKWKEEKFDSDRDEIEIATKDELKINSMKLLHIKGKRIVLARTEDSYVAFDDHCTHRGGSLAGGSTMCNVVQCPWHGSQFDLITGEVKSGPAHERIKIYSVKEDKGKIILLF